jgi:hypothetical protein
VLSVSSESEPGTSSAFVADVSGTPSAFPEDVPAAAVVAPAVVAPAVVAPAVVVTAVATAAAVTAAIAAIVAFAITANGFLLFGCERLGVPEAFRLPGILPDVSVTGLSALPGVISGMIGGSGGNAA